MKIERNIPMPAPVEKPRSERVPVESMDVGDSVLITGKTRVQACGICKATAMRAGLRFNFKSANENGAVRVWRVS